jgi:hypothetical protein
MYFGFSPRWSNGCRLWAIEKKEKVVADVSWWEERVQERHVLLLYDVDLSCFHRAESMELRSQRFIRLMRPKHGSCGNGFIEKARRWPVVDLDPCPSCLRISY